MMYITAYMSIGLAVFNLIPLPPLDGSKVLFSLMSETGIISSCAMSATG
ncbi:MAG: site-2 protease family protein [Oscillospiraceae bacterium]